MPAPTSGPRMLRGDEAELFTRYWEPLRATVRRAVYADDATVDDACSFAWLQLLRCQPRRDTAFAWLRTVAIRETWRLTRLAGVDVALDELPDEALHGTDCVETSAAARDALATLASLPERQRACLALHIAGWSYEEIAAHRGVSFTSVNKALVKGRRRIRAMCTEDAA